MNNTSLYHINSRNGDHTIDLEIYNTSKLKISLDLVCNDKSGGYTLKYEDKTNSFIADAIQVAEFVAARCGSKNTDVADTYVEHVTDQNDKWSLMIWNVMYGLYNLCRGEYETQQGIRHKMDGYQLIGKYMKLDGSLVKVD